MKITPIIGLEVHVELSTDNKMFCSCSAHHFHVDPNTHTCPVCLGLPGALPVPNKTACLYCIKIGLALNCSVNKFSFFERKNYFYPDLPKGYQITQMSAPFTINGFIKVDGQKIRINRAHMEEDTGKSQHQLLDMQDVSLIDYNRSGVPLVEIVSEPDINSSALAKSYLEKIQQTVRYLGVSDADIEKGSMRCEPTINLKIEKDGQIFYTPLAEIKNVASLTGVQTAIDFEIKRQTEEFSKTGQVKNSSNKTTRGFNADKNITFLQRHKEGNADYRYFPEPDIPPIEFSQKDIDVLISSLPELPDQKISRYQKDYALSDYDVQRICADINFAKAFEKAIADSFDKDFIKFVVNLFLGSISSFLNESNSQINIDNINHKYFMTLYKAVSENKISSTVAKQIIIDSYQANTDPLKIAQDRGLLQISDTSKLEEIVQKVLEDNHSAKSDYQKNPNIIGFLIGLVMKASNGSANPQMVRKILEKRLK